MRRIVLRVDAVFLTVAGVFGLVFDLHSYTSGSGPHAFFVLSAARRSEG